MILLHAHPRRRRLRIGVTLLELMIALAIVSSLLVATGLALASSFEAYAVSTEQSSLVQNARVAMHRIVTSIRTSSAHAPVFGTTPGSFTGLTPVTTAGIAIIDPDGNDVIFRHDAPTKRLLAVVNGTERVIAHGVDDFSVTMVAMKSEEAERMGLGFDLLRRASVKLTMHNDAKNRTTSEADRHQTITLTAAVTPRQNNW